MKSSKSGPVDFQDGDMRSSILEIMQTEEDIMNSCRRIGESGDCYQVYEEPGSHGQN